MNQNEKSNLLGGGLIAIGAFCLGLLVDVGGSTVSKFWGIPSIILLILGMGVVGTKPLGHRKE